MAGWLIHRPDVHPFWDHFYFSLASLREFPGLAAPKLRYPEAEFEVVLLALDPQWPAPDPNDKSSIHFLIPPNYAGQFHGLSDDDAKLVLQHLAVKVISGDLLPETEGFRGAVELWDRALQSAVSVLQAVESSEKREEVLQCQSAS